LWWVYHFDLRIFYLRQLFQERLYGLNKGWVYLASNKQLLCDRTVLADSSYSQHAVLLTAQCDQTLSISFSLNSVFKKLKTGHISDVFTEKKFEGCLTVHLPHEIM